MTNDPDPFAIDPELWFALLCEGVRQDQNGRLTLDRIVSQFRLFAPPSELGIAKHAHLQAALVVGLIGGMGTFVADVTLENPDGAEMWRRDEPWHIQLSGGANSSILVHPLDLWFNEAGTYRFWIRVRGRPLAWPARFEVAEQIGPPRQEQEQQ